MDRPTMDRTMLDVCAVLAKRGTCIKLQVGCVLCDAYGRVLSTGYNGVARGMPHCNAVDFGIATDLPHRHPHLCAGALALPGSDLCEAIHAESNALLQCHDPDKIVTCYTSVSPCQRCTKELLQTGCRRIVFSAHYKHNPQAEALWQRDNQHREWIHLP